MVNAFSPNTRARAELSAHGIVDLNQLVTRSRLSLSDQLIQRAEIDFAGTRSRGSGRRRPMQCGMRQLLHNLIKQCASKRAGTDNPTPAWLSGRI